VRHGCLLFLMGVLAELDVAHHVGRPASNRVAV
jgi:hypothetical protein